MSTCWAEKCINLLQKKIIFLFIHNYIAFANLTNDEIFSPFLTVSWYFEFKLRYYKSGNIMLRISYIYLYNSKQHNEYRPYEP